jgi:hypothetical protein
MPFYIHVGGKGETTKVFTIQVKDQTTGLTNSLTLRGNVNWTRDAGKNILLSISNAVDPTLGAPAGSYIFGEKKK